MSDEFSEMDAKNGFANIQFLKPKKYLCPTHGETENFISSEIKGHEGHWCQG